MIHDWAQYGSCQTLCNAEVVLCYVALGYVFGTVSKSSASPEILACNASQGTCMKACAAVSSARDVFPMVQKAAPIVTENLIAVSVSQPQLALIGFKEIIKIAIMCVVMYATKKAVEYVIQ